MSLPTIFDPLTTAELTTRIGQLSPQSQAAWGKMNVSQMLAHCCVPYEQAFGERQEKPPLMMKLMLRLFAKKGIINDVPYKPNLPTAPSFIIKDERDFQKEKDRLTAYVAKAEQLGKPFFDNKEHWSIGKLSTSEWSNMLYKHLDHHLRQFGV